MATESLVLNPDGSITRTYASGAKHSVGPGASGSAGAAAALSKGMDLSKVSPEVRELINSYTPEMQRVDERRLQEDYIEGLRQAQVEGSTLDAEQQALIRAADRGKILTTLEEIYDFDPTIVREKALLNQPGAMDFFRERDDVRAAIERAMKSGGYSTRKIDDWVAYAERNGLEKALTKFQKENPGSGAAVTSVSKDLGALSAKRILATTPEVGLPAVAAAIPSFNAANLYQPANFQPQQPLYPTQPQAGLRAALQTPSLIDMPVEQPTLTPQTAYLTQAPLLAEPVARPTLDTRTAYIGAGTPTTMRAGGVIGYQEGGRTPLSPQEAGSRFDISEYIDPETGRFYINEFQRDVVFNPELREAERVARERMTPEVEAFAIEQMRGRFGLPGAAQFKRPYAEGGSVAQEAKGLAALGRGGDSMLVHMTPDEVVGLQALAQQYGTSLTINPETGLPEAKKLRKLLPYIAAALAAPFIGPAAAALAAGAGTAIGSGSIRKGIEVGLGAYGISSATAGMMGSNPLGLGGQESTFNLANTFSAAPAQTKVGGAGSGAVDVTGGVDLNAAGRSYAGANLDGSLTAQSLQPAAAGTAGTAGTAAAKTAGGMKIDPISGALLATTLYGGAEGLEENKEQRRIYEEQQREMAEEERRRRGLGYAAYERSGLANIPMSAGGGLVAMAQGGMPTFEYGGTTAPTGEPRMVQGAGDGMSDNVPASIEGVQEARLANDEFVIPADVVADIGNGSSSSGAKKLYAMMDRIRKARHGTTEQPPEIDAEQLMPA
jgi:hypothetical protein